MTTTLHNPPMNTPTSKENHLTDTAAKPAAKGTEYQILVETHNHDDTWLACGTVTARSAEAAIRQYVTTDGGAGGKFRAIPARSWGDEPVTVTVETKTSIRLD